MEVGSSRRFVLLFGAVAAVSLGWLAWRSGARDAKDALASESKVVDEREDPFDDRSSARHREQRAPAGQDESPTARDGLLAKADGPHSAIDGVVRWRDGRALEPPLTALAWLDGAAPSTGEVEAAIREGVSGAVLATEVEPDGAFHFENADVGLRYSVTAGGPSGIVVELARRVRTGGDPLELELSAVYGVVVEVVAADGGPPRRIGASGTAASTSTSRTTRPGTGSWRRDRSRRSTCSRSPTCGWRSARGPRIASPSF